MPFARYFCIFINVGLGEGAAWPVGVADKQTPDTSLRTGLRCNGTAVIGEPYREIIQTDPVSIRRELPMNGMTDSADGRGGDNRRSVVSAPLPTVFTI
ncbi:hypothetical protein G999_02695 [Escherichia coli UMEA 3893-1]|nr:hypothetical protein G999_02695 [Escherichia coli UMEA 3893-1]